MTRLLLVFILGIPAGALRAWTLSVLWGWFAVPLELPAVSLWTTWGFTYLYVMATYNPFEKSNIDEDKSGWLIALELNISVALVSLLLLGSGWVLTQLGGN